MSIEDIIMKNRFNDLIDKITITMSGDHIQKKMIINTIEGIRDSYKTKVIEPERHKKIETATITGKLKTAPKQANGTQSLYFFIERDRPFLKMKIYVSDYIRNAAIDLQIKDHVIITGCLKSPVSNSNAVYLECYSITKIDEEY